MELSCPHCTHNFEFPDSKLPSAPRFSIKCPSCREKIVVERDTGKEIAPPGSTGAIKAETIEPDIYPPGAEVAFIFVQSGAWSGAAEAFFSSKGYYMSNASDTEEAVLKLRINKYDVVVIDDRFSNKALLKEIGSWHGLKRRWVNVIIVGDKAISMDPKEAFTRGVNSYINMNDADQARDLLEETLKAFEIQNEPWRMAMEQEWE